MEDLLRKWLYMKAMEYAIDMMAREYRRYLYPMDKFHEWKWEDEIDRKILLYALDHWTTPTYQGSNSGHSRYSIGLDASINGKGVTATYKDLEASITWPQVKTFVRQMLDYEPEDKQITMFELLSQEAMTNDGNN